VPNS
jgi:mannan polymerase II complex MNN10 subunit